MFDYPQDVDYLDNNNEWIVTKPELTVLITAHGIVYGWLVATEDELKQSSRDIDTVLHPSLWALDKMINKTYPVKGLGTYIHIVIKHLPHLIEGMTYKEDIEYALRLLHKNETKEECIYAKEMLDELYTKMCKNESEWEHAQEQLDILSTMINNEKLDNPARDVTLQSLSKFSNEGAESSHNLIKYSIMNAANRDGGFQGKKQGSHKK